MDLPSLTLIHLLLEVLARVRYHSFRQIGMRYELIFGLVPSAEEYQSHCAPAHRNVEIPPFRRHLSNFMWL